MRNRTPRPKFSRAKRLFDFFRKGLKNFHVWASVTFVVVIASSYLVYHELRQETIILAVTALIMVFYTYESYQMRQELAKIHTTPFVTVFIERNNPEDGTPRYRCLARNESQASAIDVQFKVFGTIEGKTLAFENVCAISQFQEKEFAIKIMGKNGGDHEESISFDDFYRQYMVNHSSEIPCELRFKNMFFRDYVVKMEYRKGNFFRI